MSETGSHNRAADVRSVLARWCIVLVAVAVFAAWSTWRMQRVASKLSDISPRVAANTTASEEIEYWTCSMHPDVHQSELGDCPQCGMDLIAKYVGSDELGVKPREARLSQGVAVGKTKPKRWYM